LIESTQIQHIKYVCFDKLIHQVIILMISIQYTQMKLIFIIFMAIFL